MRLRFFRALWGCNAIVIALGGTLAVVVLGLALVTMAGPLGGRSAGRDGGREPAPQAAQAEARPLELRFARGAFGNRDALLATLVEPGDDDGSFSSRGDSTIIRNILVFDRASGQGRRLLDASPAAEIDQYYGVDANCRGFGGIRNGEVEVATEAPASRLAGVLIVWAEPQDVDWRLSIADLNGGRTREIVKGVVVQSTSSTESGRCYVLLKSGDAHFTLEFGLDGASEPRRVNLVAP